MDPDKVRICNCTDCQQLSDTTFRVMRPCSESYFQLKTGEPKIYVKTAESGRRRKQAVCWDCGPLIYAIFDESKGARVLGLRAGVLAQSRALIPRRQFWYRSVHPFRPPPPGIAEGGTARQWFGLDYYGGVRDFLVLPDGDRKWTC